MLRVWERTGKDWKSLHLPCPANCVSLTVQTQRQVLLPVPRGCPRRSLLGSQRLMYTKSRMWQCHEILPAARQGLCSGLWDSASYSECCWCIWEGFGGEEQSAAPGHEHRPCPAGCCAWRGSLLPGVGPGLAHLPAGTRVALVKGEGGDPGAECM